MSPWNSTLPPKRERPRRTGEPAPRIKPEREEDPEHLAKLRRFGCWACWMDGWGRVEAEPHHPRTGGLHGPGMAQRAPDKDAIPLCPGHHRGCVGYISIHLQPDEFRAQYGTEEEIRDHVLALLEKHPHI